jgi:hypothetical protein
MTASASCAAGGCGPVSDAALRREVLRPLRAKVGQKFDLGCSSHIRRKSPYAGSWKLPGLDSNQQPSG